MLLRSHKTVEIKVFLNVFVCSPDRPKTHGSYGSGSGSGTLSRNILTKMFLRLIVQKVYSTVSHESKGLCGTGPYEPAEFIEGPEAKGKEGEGARPSLPHHTVV